MTNDWIQELGDTIRAHCKKQGISMAEQSRRIGRSGDFLNKVARWDSVGVKAVRYVAAHIPLPESVIRGAEEHGNRINVVRRRKLTEAHRAWAEKGHNVAQPWTETVAKLKAEKPIYARSW